MSTRGIFIIVKTLIFWSTCVFLNIDTLVGIFILITLEVEYGIYFEHSEINEIGYLIIVENLLLVELWPATLRISTYSQSPIFWCNCVSMEIVSLFFNNQLDFQLILQMGSNLV